ncbi:hypothetical protein QVD17_38275 [Tagetes erecta]|uniref:Uncharacterized protein n=1 Tax=Tagetes erecta TaxID=13708 RepID=A0AAD8K223_TARER|nr:hypothetical protein QVD17_38275 [Tagetes erecta]
MIVEEPSIFEDVSVPEPVDVIQIVQEVIAEVETVAQAVDDADAAVTFLDPVDVPTTSSPATPLIEQPMVSSPKVVSSDILTEKDKEIERLNKNMKWFKQLDDEYEKLKEDYKELYAECNTLNAEKEMLEKWLEEAKPKKSGSTSDKDFSDDVMEVSRPSQAIKVYYTRARGIKAVGEKLEVPIQIPDEAANIVNLDKAEGKRKLDAVQEIVKEDVIAKKARTEETVQIEPIQSESVQATEVPEFEPIQTDIAHTIEALDYLDDVDFTDSEPEANPVDDIPTDLDERFAYLEKMKYNPVYLNGLTVSQINEEYEKCINAQDNVVGDDKEFVVEMGEWTPLQESLNIDDLPQEELYHQNAEEMSVPGMRQVLEPKEIPLMALPEDEHKKRKELIDMFPSEMKSYNIPMEVRESWHKSATVGDIVRPLLSKGQSVADLLDSMIVPEKSKDVKIIAWKYDEIFDVFLIKRVNGLCDVYHYYSSIFKLPVQDLKELHKISRMPKFLEFQGQQEDKAYLNTKKKKQKKLILRDMYLEEFSDEYFDKVTDPGLKVIDGSQATKPILKCFYNQETYELKLVRNLDDWNQDMITLFSTFELKLLHPSYIDYLRNHKMEKLKDPVAEEERRLFVIMIEGIGAANEKIRLRKALLNANLVKIDMPEIEYMRVTSKGTLEVKVKGKKKPYEFYANIDFAGIFLDTLKRMKDCDIATNESKPRQAKIAEKFESCIEEALKEQEEYKGKPLLDVKEEYVDF